MEVFVFILIVLAIYFLPLTVALIRNTKRFAGILLLNLFLGWTIIGWVIALVWVVSDSEAIDHAVCPFCAEQIKPQATVCPHCRRDLPPQVKSVIPQQVRL
jgi:hypothetical protein